MDKKSKTQLEKEIDKTLTRIMLKIGFYPSYTGFYVFKEAVFYIMKNRHAPICKEVYPYLVGEGYKNCEVIERNIRHMIQTAYNNGALMNINEIIGLPVLRKYQKVGNSYILKLVAEHLLTIYDIED